jgi:Zn-dependent protease with chaperone function
MVKQIQIIIFIILISFLFQLTRLIAQPISPFSRTYIDTLPNRFELDVEDLRDHIYQDIPNELRNEEFPRKTYRFADLSSIQISNLFSSGQVYSDWTPLEQYVNKILEKVIPEVLRDEKYLHVYIIKSGDFNAFMTPSGMIFINIGLFADINDEATLAGILAHELAHHYLKHSINTYVKSENGEFKPRMLYKNKEAYSKFSIKSELEADDLAFQWIRQSGYNTEGLFNAFKISERHEQKILAQYLDMWEVTSTTHPTSEERLSKLKEFSQKEPDTSGKFFLVSKNGFIEFQKQAKPEILKYLLINFNFLECIEKAFIFHIYDIENPTYVYYLMEAIRRSGYLDSSIWAKNFITFTYLKEVITEQERKKVRLKKHLFEEFPYEILALPPDAFENIQGKFYWEGDPKFTTYEEAFLFFEQVGELYNNPECILAKALTVSHDDDEMKKYLYKYLSKDKIKYRKYAETLIIGELKSSLRNKKLTIVSDFILVVKQGKEEIPIREENNSDIQYLKGIVDNISKDFADREFILLPELKYSRMNDYLILSELEQFSFISLLARGTQTELFILDPKYWELMNRFEVNEIEFINCQYYDNRKYQYKLEPYKEVANTNFESLFSEVKKHRYFEVLISSVRAIEGLRMKTLYYGGEEKLIFKSPAYQQVVDKIKTKIIHKDEVTKEYDEKIKKRNQN